MKRNNEDLIKEWIEKANHDKDVLPDDFVNMALEVQSFSIEVRYPGNKVKLDEYNVKNAINAAEKFREHILKKMDMIK